MNTTEGTVTCGVGRSRCRCVLPYGHEDDVHVCDPGCGGKWRGHDEDTFEVVAFPTLGGMGLPR